MNNKHLLIYCTKCRVLTLKCSECGIGGCSGGHLDGCTKVEENLWLSKCLTELLEKTNLADRLDDDIYP